MKNLRLLCAFCLFVGQITLANQIVLSVPNEDFNPLKQTTWQVLVGNTAASFSSSDFSRNVRGLGIAVERQFFTNLNFGLQYANMKSNTTEKINANEQRQYTEAINSATLYGKYAIVNYSLNKWNLMQLHVLGGISSIEKMKPTPQPVYGAALTYNYDNLIGMELDSKVNTEAESLSSLSLIGYF